MHYIYMYRSNIWMKHIFIVVIFSVCIINSYFAKKHIYSIMCADETIVNEIVSINEYFKEEKCNVLYFTDGNTINKLCKYMDTYFEPAECLYTVDHSFIASMEIEKINNINEITLREHIFDGVYKNVEKIDYFIVENTIDFDYKRLANIKDIPEISGEHYTVYQNLNPATISITLNENLYFSGNKLEIFFSGDNYNASQYIFSGISEKENGFSWTDGDTMQVTIPVNGEYENLEVHLEIGGTFYGAKSYRVRQDNKEITTGIIENQGEISFVVVPEKSKLTFEIDFPDAQVISDVIEGSNDKRKVALQLQKMTIYVIE